jgi:hypothetical protein
MYVSRALSKVLEPESASATFQNLAKKLIALLQKPSATASPALPAALKALGTLGQVAPAVFADHACSMADFVLDELLEAPMSSLSPSKASHLKAPVEGKTGASPHQGIVLKMLGLKVSLYSFELITPITQNSLYISELIGTRQQCRLRWELTRLSRHSPRA